jgi:CRISPR-associated endoribonuclease Cas6
MERLSPEYATFLHNQEVNPYSMNVRRGENGDIIWVVNVLTTQAYEQIAKLLLSDEFKTFHLKALNSTVEITNKATETFAVSELTRIFYEDCPSNRISCKFLTPVSFKHAGRYTILPDVRLIFQSLMMKYALVCDGIKLADDNLLQELIKRTEIVQYKVMSSYYKVDKAKVPGFIGEVTFRVTGSHTLVNYVAMLLKFGEFSGCGIKTAMGMGALESYKQLKKGDGDGRKR